MSHLQVHLVLQHRPRVYLRFVPAGEMEGNEVLTQLNHKAGTQT